MAGRRLLAVVAVALLVASASQGASAPTVSVTQSKLGPILVDASGRTLYLWTAETHGQIQCTADILDCTHSWLPLVVTGKPKAGPEVNSKLLSTVRRTKPAGLQVTYNGHPLYRCVTDKKPRDVICEGVDGSWYAVSRKGTPIKK